MPIVSTPALVLHAFPYGDTSRILRLLTPEYGVRSLIAKGASSPRSRFGGVLEPFTEGEAQFHLRENRDLLTLSGFTLIRGRQGIGRDLVSFTGASLAAEIVLRFATEEPQPELFHTLASALDKLADPHLHPTGQSFSAIWSVIATFGLRPRVDDCVRCGRELPAAEGGRFDAEAGGIVCGRCGSGRRYLTPVLRDELTAMCTGGLAGAPEDAAAHGDLLHSFLAAHVLHGRPLRSLPMFLDLLR